MDEKTVPSPPETPPISTSARTTEVSLERLDSLLETYLELLDQYTTLRTQLSKQFSDGFFSLTRANHTSPSLGSGRRYGEEGYDERMKAGRRVVYGPTVSGADEKDTTDQQASQVAKDETGAAGKTKQETDALTGPTYRISVGKVSDPAPPLDQTENDNTTISQSQQQDPKSTSPSISFKSSATKATTISKSKPKSPDPLHWYGILVPQALRQSQSFFTSAVSSTVPSLITVSAEMHELESRITNIRMELGLQREGSEHSEATEAQEEEDTGISPKEEGKQRSFKKSNPEAILGSTGPRKRLVQRPAEPRSRILILDS